MEDAPGIKNCPFFTWPSQKIRTYAFLVILTAAQSNILLARYTTRVTARAINKKIRVRGLL